MRKTFEEIVHEEMNSIRQFLPNEASESICFQAMVNMMILTRKATLKELAFTVQPEVNGVGDDAEHIIQELEQSHSIEVTFNREEVLHLPGDSLIEEYCYE
jgi:hypothetical protein